MLSAPKALPTNARASCTGRSQAAALPVAAGCSKAAAVKRATSAVVNGKGPAPSLHAAAPAHRASAVKATAEKVGGSFPLPMDDKASGVVAMVLGGGPADFDKLYPLTEKRALPAIPVGGVYRLIDIPISNLLNSGINKMYIITQFQSQSLNRHLTRTYTGMAGGSGGREGFIEVLSMSQTPNASRWSEGTADAVRQFGWLLEDLRSKREVRDVIILPSDQLYRADFDAAVASHRAANADITLLCTPAGDKEAESLGVVKVECKGTGPDEVCLVSDFKEKPRDRAKEMMRLTQAEIGHFAAVSAASARRAAAQRQRKARATGQPKEAAVEPAATEVAAGHGGLSEDRPFMGSTGIYIFRRSVLIDLLRDNKGMNDFGKELIPKAVHSGLKVMGLVLPGPWRDVGGSVGDVYDAHMAMARAPAVTVQPGAGPEQVEQWRDAASAATFFDPVLHPQKLFHAPGSLPPVHYKGKARISQSLISPGCEVGGDCTITGSVVGSRAIIGSNVTIEDSVIMGADFYEGDDSTPPHMGVGNGSIIRKALVDKNACIGENVQLINKEGLYNSADYAATGVYIRDGVVVVAKGAVIPAGTII